VAPAVLGQTRIDVAPVAHWSGHVDRLAWAEPGWPAVDRHAPVGRHVGAPPHLARIAEQRVAPCAQGTPSGETDEAADDAHVAIQTDLGCV
jgi:hypothetical protein